MRLERSDLTIAAAAAPAGTLQALTVITVVAVAVIGPSIALLFWLQQQSRLESHPEAGRTITGEPPQPPP